MYSDGRNISLQFDQSNVHNRWGGLILSAYTSDCCTLDKNTRFLPLVRPLSEYELLGQLGAYIPKILAFFCKNAKCDLDPNDSHKAKHGSFHGILYRVNAKEFGKNMICLF